MTEINWLAFNDAYNQPDTLMSGEQDRLTHYGIKRINELLADMVKINNEIHTLFKIARDRYLEDNPGPSNNIPFQYGGKL